jgi:methionyl-tRNA formyltransferase
MRVLFMGTPVFAIPSLRVIHREAVIVGVCTQPDRPQGRGLKVQPSKVKEEALRLNLEVRTPERLSDPGVFEWAQSLKPDVLCVVAYGKILREAWLNLPRLGGYNLHGSLLPRWRGAAPVARAIQAGDFETGACLMRLVREMDAGEVYSEVRVPILSHYDSASLMQNLAEKGAELWIPFLNQLVHKKPQGKPQDPKLVTFAEKLRKEEGLLLWRHPAEVLERQVRAFEPWPKSFLYISGKKLLVRSARFLNQDAKKGWLEVSPGHVLLGTSQGALQCLSLQWEGGKVLDATSFALHHQGSWPVDPS